MADTTGKLHLSVDYPGETQEAPTIPAFGMEWTLPVEYSNLRFYGTGPEETYADRKHAKLGIWNTNAYAIMRRTSCRRKPATMRMCVGLRLRMMPVMACA